MAGALFWFWQLDSHLSEGRTWLERLLSLGTRANRARAKALDAVGWLALLQTDLARTRDAYEESMVINRELGDLMGIARSLSGLASLSYDAAEYDTARRLHEESLAIRREIGHTGGISASLNNLGLVARRQGDYDRAVEAFEEGLSLARKSGDRERISLLLGNLGKVRILQGDFEQAKELLNEGLALARELKYRLAIALSLWQFGELAYAQGESHRAIVLLRAFRDLLDSLGINLDEVDREPFERTMDELQASVGEEDFSQAPSVGSSDAALQQMIAYALGEAENFEP
jgi:tetratricopeptide (TPR) repeat protein